MILRFTGSGGLADGVSLRWLQSHGEVGLWSCKGWAACYVGIASPDNNRVDVCFLTKSLLVQESVRVICKTQESISLAVIPEALEWSWWVRAGGRYRPETVQLRS